MSRVNSGCIANASMLRVCQNQFLITAPTALENELNAFAINQMTTQFHSYSAQGAKCGYIKNVKGWSLE